MDLQTWVNWLFWQRLFGWPELRDLEQRMAVMRDGEWRTRKGLGPPMLVLNVGS